MTDTSYTIRCTGLWCRKESDWDQASDSDEYYAIVTVLAADSKGGWKQVTTQVPKSGAFEDVDTGEFRKCDYLLYEGPMDHFVLGTQLMEEDEGSSTKVRELIEQAAKLAIEQGAASQGVAVPDALADNVAGLAADIFGLDDDKVDSYQQRYFGATRTKSLATGAHKVTKPEGCRYKFRTWHSGDGAHIVLYYDIDVTK